MIEGMGDSIGRGIGGEVSQALRAIADALSARVTVIDIDVTIGTGAPIRGTIRIRQEEKA